MLGNYLQQTTSADNIFRCIFFLVLLGLKRPIKNGFQDRLSLNADQKYCKMLQREHSAILQSFIKLPFVIKTFVVSIFDWPFYTGFTCKRKSNISMYGSVPYLWKTDKVRCQRV